MNLEEFVRRGANAQKAVDELLARPGNSEPDKTRRRLLACNQAMADAICGFDYFQMRTRDGQARRDCARLIEKAVGSLLLLASKLETGGPDEVFVPMASYHSRPK